MKSLISSDFRIFTSACTPSLFSLPSLNCNHVYILLDCFGISRLQSNCICTGQSSLHSVVAVDNTEVNIFQSTGYLLRCKRNDLDVVRILNDVILCCGDTSFGIQLDQTLCLQ